MSKVTYEEALKRYDKIVKKCEGIERKGKTMPYTSDNGHMFSLLNKSGELGFRFSKEVQENYIEAWNSSLFKSYNAVMRGYVLVPESMFNDLDKLAEYLRESHTYVLSLEPK